MVQVMVLVCLPVWQVNHVGGGVSGDASDAPPVIVKGQGLLRNPRGCTGSGNPFHGCQRQAEADILRQLWAWGIKVAFPLARGCCGCLSTPTRCWQCGQHFSKQRRHPRYPVFLARRVGGPQLLDLLITQWGMLIRMMGSDMATGMPRIFDISGYFPASHH